MIRAKCMKVRSIRAGSNPAGSRGAVKNSQSNKDYVQMLSEAEPLWRSLRNEMIFILIIMIILIQDNM